MKRTVSFRTSNGNIFLYSPFKKQFLLCHPIIRHLFELECSGSDVGAFIDSLRPAGVLDIPDYGRFSYQELSYQWKKYCFLKKHHFFHSPKKRNLNGRMNPSRVTENLATINQVIFETTEECNLSCTYCTYSKFYSNKDRQRRKFNPVDARKTLDHLLAIRDNCAGKLIISFYGGEPLKNIRFIREIVEYLTVTYSNRHTFKFTMSSNGLLLAKYAEFLSSNQFEISVSLDGDEDGNSFRLLPNHRSSYNLVIKNLDFIRDNYPEYFEKNISFLTVLHNRNSYNEVQKFFKQKYSKTALTSTINTLNINEEHLQEFKQTFLVRKNTDIPDQTLMHDLFMRHHDVKELADTLEKYTGFIFKNHFQVMSRINGNTGFNELIPTATCSPFSMRVFLAADGTILPCEHISRIFELGHIQNGEIYIDNESIAGMFNQHFDKIQALCDQCFLADNCKECVFNTRIETSHPRCDFFMDETRFKAYLAKNLGMIENEFSLYLRIINEAFLEHETIHE